jgi:hypothetical protein
MSTHAEHIPTVCPHRNAASLQGGINATTGMDAVQSFLDELQRLMSDFLCCA